jgi:hypothetical protein
LLIITLLLGPYALACAYALPHEMMSAVGVMAGAGPWEAGKQHVDLPRRALYSMAKNWPASLRVFTNVLVATLRRFVEMRMVTSRIDSWLNTVKQKYEEELPVEERRKQLLRIIFDGFAQGAEGAVLEARLLAEYWGFRFEDIDYENIRIWYVLLR